MLVDHSGMWPAYLLCRVISAYTFALSLTNNETFFNKSIHNTMNQVIKPTDPLFKMKTCGNSMQSMFLQTQTVFNEAGELVKCLMVQSNADGQIIDGANQILFEGVNMLERWEKVDPKTVFAIPTVEQVATYFKLDISQSNSNEVFVRDFIDLCRAVRNGYVYHNRTVFFTELSRTASGQYAKFQMWYVNSLGAVALFWPHTDEIAKKLGYDKDRVQRNRAWCLSASGWGFDKVQGSTERISRAITDLCGSNHYSFEYRDCL